MNFSYFNIKIIKTKKDAKNQYRKLTLRYHPDTCGTDAAMKIINSEYNFLIDNFNTIINSFDNKNYDNYNENIVIKNDNNNKKETVIDDLEQFIIDNDIFIWYMPPMWTRGSYEWKKVVVNLYKTNREQYEKIRLETEEKQKKSDRLMDELSKEISENGGETWMWPRNKMWEYDDLYEKNIYQNKSIFNNMTLFTTYCLLFTILIISMILVTILY